MWGLLGWFGGLEKNVVHFVHYDFGNAVALGCARCDQVFEQSLQFLVGHVIHHGISFLFATFRRGVRMFLG